MTDSTKFTNSNALDEQTLRDTGQIAQIAAELRGTYDAGVTKPLAWRLAQLDGLDLMLVENEGAFADALLADLGKDPAEAYITETSFVRAELKLIRGKFKQWLQPKMVKPSLAVLPATAYT